MLQHTQSHCLACQRPTLHLRSTYDVPHTAHLIFVCALGLGALVARDGLLSPLLIIAATCWLLIWASHSFVNLFAAGVPFRCHDCGSPVATAAALAGVSEQQRLQAALAKAAAKKGAAVA